MSKAEERGGTYAIHKASEKLHDYYGNAMLSIVQFDGYDIKNAYIEGYHKAEKELIEKGIYFLKYHLEGYDIFGSDIERSVESFKLAMKDEYDRKSS